MCVCDGGDGDGGVGWGDDELILYQYPLLVFVFSAFLRARQLPSGSRACARCMYCAFSVMDRTAIGSDGSGTGSSVVRLGSMPRRAAHYRRAYPTLTPARVPLRARGGALHKLPHRYL